MISAILHELVTIVTWPTNTGKHGGYNLWSTNAVPNPYSLGIIGVLWHRHNCHQPRCWRPVRHGRIYCKHHPVPPASIDPVA